MTRPDNGMSSTSLDEDEKQNLNAMLSNALSLSVRQHIRRYYDCWLISDDPTENTRTKQQSVRHDRFLVGGGRWIRVRRE